MGLPGPGILCTHPLLIFESGDKVLDLVSDQRSHPPLTKYSLYFNLKT